MNRTIKPGEADRGMVRWIIPPRNVKRFHYDSHDQLRTHPNELIAPYDFTRRLRTLDGLTP